MKNGVMKSSFEKEQHSCGKISHHFQISELTICLLNYFHYFTCIHSIALKSARHSFQKVSFKTHSSPSERVWHCLSSRTKGNPFIFMYIAIAIPSKEGDVSVRKCKAAVSEFEREKMTSF